MQKIEVDKSTWKNWMNRIPDGFSEKLSKCSSGHEAMLMIGCAVKSKERDKDDRLPRDFGLLVHRDKDEAVVICQLTYEWCFKRPLVIWTGTLAEYFEQWECD